MESGIDAIPNNCGRVGAWFTYNDGAGTQYPAPIGDAGGNPFVPSLIPNGGRGTSLYAAHTYGSNFTVYAGMGVTLNGLPGSASAPYDAAAQGYTGFKFYAMLGTTIGAQSLIEVNAVDKYSSPYGGLCNPNVTNGPTQCSDHPRMAVSLSTAWTLVTVPFNKMMRGGWGYGGFNALDTTGIYTIGFEDNTETLNPEPFTFDIWIDDISFTP